MTMRKVAARRLNRAGRKTLAFPHFSSPDVNSSPVCDDLRPFVFVQKCPSANKPDLLSGPDFALNINRAWLYLDLAGELPAFLMRTSFLNPASLARIHSAARSPYGGR